MSEQVKKIPFTPAIAKTMAEANAEKQEIDNRLKLYICGVLDGMGLRYSKYHIDKGQIIVTIKPEEGKKNVKGKTKR